MKPLLCLTIETRPLPNLIEYIRQHLSMLPSDIELAIVCGPANQEILYKEFPNALLFSVDRSLDNVQMYNRLLTSPAFWESWVGYHRVLVFQHDSMILRPGIEEFLENDQIDYWGASWRWNQDHIGNGGLSLRNPRVMLEVCKQFPGDGALNEDHWITKHMFEYNIGTLAPIALADKFSVEQKHVLGSWGCHAISVWQTPEECHKILNQYK